MDSKRAQYGSKGAWFCRRASGWVCSKGGLHRIWITLCLVSNYALRGNTCFCFPICACIYFLTNIEASSDHARKYVLYRLTCARVLAHACKAHSAGKRAHSLFCPPTFLGGFFSPKLHRRGYLTLDYMLFMDLCTLKRRLVWARLLCPPTWMDECQKTK